MLEDFDILKEAILKVIALGLRINGGIEELDKLRLLAVKLKR